MRKVFICGVSFALAFVVAISAYVMRHHYAFSQQHALPQIHAVASRSENLSLELFATKTSLRIGEEADIFARITNVGTESVRLVMPGDGSEQGMRTPVISWSVLRFSSTESHPSQPVPDKLGCGNLNELEFDELFTLAPGESKELPQLYQRPFESPGKYRLVFLYANRPTMEWGGVTHHNQVAMLDVQGSTECNLVSNEVLIEVR